MMLLLNEASSGKQLGPTRLRHSHIGAVNRSIAPMCLDVGAVSEKCRSIAPMCLDVGAVSEKCWRTLQYFFGVGPTQLQHSYIGAVHRSIAPRGLDVGAENLERIRAGDLSIIRASSHHLS